MKFCLILVITMLSSCSVINKHKTKERSHTTEHTVASENIQASSKKDSAHLQQKFSDTLNEDVIAIEFDNEGFAQDDEHVHEYDSPAVIKTLPSQPAKVIRTYNYKVGEKKIVSAKPIKKIFIRNTSAGKTAETTTTEVKSIDTTHQARIVETVKTADIKKTDLTKKTKNYTSLVIGILIAMVAGYLIYNILGYVKGWEGIWFLFRRKKDQSTT